MSSTDWDSEAIGNGIVIGILLFLLLILAKVLIFGNLLWRSTWFLGLKMSETIIFTA